VKVSIQHVEKASGLLNRVTLHGVEVHVTFSEEERSIIEHRNLKYDVVMERGHSADLSAKKIHARENRRLARRLITAAVSGADANTPHLTINKLMKGPDLFFLATPLDAKTYEEELRGRLVQLKDYITGNAEITDRSSSFEL